MDSIKRKVCELLSTPMKRKQLGKQYGVHRPALDHTSGRSRESNDAKTENFRSHRRKKKEGILLRQVHEVANVLLRWGN